MLHPEPTLEPCHITFTGADDVDDLGRMHALSSLYKIEWGLLISKERMGTPRYPSLETRQTFLSCPGMSFALHICGEYARDIMSYQSPDLPVDLTKFSRLQINHPQPDADAIWAFQLKTKIPCIAQCRGHRFPDHPHIQWLYDPSGGTGQKPAKWPEHPQNGLDIERHASRMLGYAGGLNPENIREVLEEIETTQAYWIDMESGVRSADENGRDRFDIDRCASVCAEVYRIKISSEAT